jgi:hypothetical protein
VTAALFGLFGVFIGGAINYWIQTQVVRRRATADLRSALRLLNSQINHAMVVLQTSEEWRVPWAVVGDTIIIHEIWRQALPQLAAYLQHDAWQAVEAAYAELSRAEMAAQGLRNMGGEDWDDGHGALVDRPLAATARAKEAVAALATDDLWKRHLLRP